MKKIKMVVLASLSATLLATGCSVKEGKQTSSNGVETAASAPNDLMTYIAKQQDEIIAFSKVIDYPNLPEYNKETIAEVNANAFDSKDVSIEFLFKDENTGKVDFSFKAEKENKMASQYTNNPDFTKVTINGVVYYYNKDGSGILYFNSPSGQDYELRGITLDGEKLLSIAQTFNKNEELARLIALDKEKYQKLDYIYEDDQFDGGVSDVSIGYRNSFYKNEEMFLTSNLSVQVYETSSDRSYSTAVEAMKDDPENVYEVDLKNGVKGIYTKSGNSLDLKIEDRYFNLQRGAGLSEIPLEKLVETANEIIQ